jgi:hypothetical protein
MRSRPDVTLRLTSLVRPGDDVVAELSLDVASRTPVEHVTITLEGERSLGTDVSSRVPPVLTRFLNLEARVAEKVTLEPGKHAYRALFHLPKDVPCSFLGSLINVRYIARVRVAIPWWLDVDEPFECVVSQRAMTRSSQAAASATAHGADQPFIEVALGDVYFSPGEAISGVFALGNLHGSRAHGVDIDIAGYERTYGRYVAEAFRFNSFRNLGDAAEGVEVPFSLKIPKNAPLSFARSDAALSWSLEVRVELDGQTIVHATPITIGLFGGPSGPQPVRATIGVGRWHAVWADVAQRAGLSIDRYRLELSGDMSSASVRVALDESDGGGIAATLTLATSLGLDLHVSPARLFGRSIDLNDAELAKRFRVQGRSPEQVRAFFQPPLRRVLLGFDMVTMTDRRVTVLSRTPGRDQPWIGEFVSSVRALAVLLAEASENVPPPPGLELALPAFRAFAERTGSRLSIAGAALEHGSFDGARFELTTLFDDTVPNGTRLTVARPTEEASPEAPSEEASSELALSLETLLVAAPAGTREIVASLAKTGALEVTAHALSLTYATTVADPATCRTELAALAALGERLRGGAHRGPYR